MRRAPAGPEPGVEEHRLTRVVGQDLDSPDAARRPATFPRVRVETIRIGREFRPEDVELRKIVDEAVRRDAHVVAILELRLAGVPDAAIVTPEGIAPVNGAPWGLVAFNG